MLDQTQNSFGETDALALRKQFAYFRQQDEHAAAGSDFSIYLDSAATSQRPDPVLDAEREFITLQNAAVHRGTSNAVGEATNRFENARKQVAQFLGAPEPEYTVVWAAGATDALNTIATGISEATAALNVPELGVPGSERLAIHPGDEIVTTEAEHHANLIPWQRLAARCGAKLVVVPVDETGTWSVAAIREVLNSRTRVVAFTDVSNVTGWRSPAAAVVQSVKELAPNAVTVLDACQSVPHVPVNIAATGVDFAVFSGHKMFAPNGIGALVGRTELLAALPPARTGGSAITRVSTDSAEFMPPPLRFEPGTQPVSQVVGLGAAIEFISGLDLARLAAYEHSLVEYLVSEINRLNGVTLLGPADPADRVALAAVNVAGVHAHDVGQVLDSAGVITRVGHHCAQPLHRALGITASVRASVHATNTVAEIDAFIAGLKDAKKYFQV